MTLLMRILDGLRDAARKVIGNGSENPTYRAPSRARPRTGTRLPALDDFGTHRDAGDDLEIHLTRQLEEMTAEIPRMSLGVAKIRNAIGKLEAEVSGNRSRATALKKRIEDAITASDDSSAETGVADLSTLAARTKRARAKLDRLNDLYGEAIRLKELHIVEIEEKTRDFEWIVRPMNLDRFRRTVDEAMTVFDSWKTEEARNASMERVVAASSPGAREPEPVSPAIITSPSQTDAAAKPVAPAPKKSAPARAKSKPLSETQKAAVMDANAVSPKTKQTLPSKDVAELTDDEVFDLEPHSARPSHTGRNAPGVQHQPARLSNPAAPDRLIPDRFDWHSPSDDE